MPFSIKAIVGSGGSRRVPIPVDISTEGLARNIEELMSLNKTLNSQVQDLKKYGGASESETKTDLKRLMNQITKNKAELKRMRARKLQMDKQTKLAKKRKQGKIIGSSRKMRRGQKQLRRKEKKTKEQYKKDKEMKLKMGQMKHRKGPSGHPDDPVHVQQASQRGKYDMSKSKKMKEKEKELEAKEKAQEAHLRGMMPIAVRQSIFGDTPATSQERVRRSGTSIDRAFGSGVGYSGHPELVKVEEQPLIVKKKTAGEILQEKLVAEYEKEGGSIDKRIKVKFTKTDDEGVPLPPGAEVDVGLGAFDPSVKTDLDTMAKVFYLYKDELEENKQRLYRELAGRIGKDISEEAIDELAQREIMDLHLKKMGYKKPLGHRIIPTQTGRDVKPRDIRVSNIPGQEFVPEDISKTKAEQRQEKSFTDSRGEALDRYANLQEQERLWSQRRLNYLTKERYKKPLKKKYQRYKFDTLKESPASSRYQRIIGTPMPIDPLAEFRVKDPLEQFKVKDPRKPVKDPLEPFKVKYIKPQDIKFKPKTLKQKQEEREKYEEADDKLFKDVFPVGPHYVSPFRYVPVIKTAEDIIEGAFERISKRKKGGAGKQGFLISC